MSLMYECNPINITIYFYVMSLLSVYFIYGIIFFYINNFMR